MLTVVEWAHYEVIDHNSQDTTQNRACPVYLWGGGQVHDMGRSNTAQYTFEYINNKKKYIL